MGKKVKVGKQRRDKYYHLAKEAGFRSRAAFKLIQLNKRFEFLQRSRFLVDLCAAPGGWLQVAQENMPMSSMRIGVDLAPIKAVKNCITLQGDITHEKTRQAIKANLANNEVDTVLNDGAPNVGQNWAKDAFDQNCLVLSALKLATQILRGGGWFVTKIFRSADYAALIQTFEKLFKKVHVWKPSASRMESAEIFVVCEKYLKPDKVDPDLLDIKKVFLQHDVDDSNNTTVRRLLAGDKLKKTKALGYDDGDITMFHQLKASDFIANSDPLLALEKASCIVLDDEKYENDPNMTDELKECIKDIRVCGGAELRKILQWRKKTLNAIAKEKHAAEKAAAANQEPDPEAEEQRELEEIDELIRNASAAEAAKLKKKKKIMLKEKKRMQERKQLGMYHEGDQIDEADDIELFNLSQIKKTMKRKALNDAAYERVSKIAKEDIKDDFLEDKSDIELDSDEDEEMLHDDDGNFQRDLIENNYEPVSDRIKQVIQKYSDQAKKKLEGVDSDEYDSELDDEEMDEEEAELDDEEEAVNEVDEEEASEVDDEEEELEDEDEGEWLDGEEEIEALNGTTESTNGVEEAAEEDGNTTTSDTESEDGEESSAFANGDVDAVYRSDEELDETDERVTKRNKDDVKVKKRLTPAQLAMGERLIHSTRSRKDVEDWGWNRWTSNDEGLPDWFIDDEKKHCRKDPPVNRERIAFYRERGRELNVRPIKAVVEAKMRKKKRQIRRMDRAKKRAEGILDSEGMEHGEKVREVQRLYKKAMRPEKKDVKYVRMTKGRRGRMNKPTNGPYKVVDSRLKKDLRANKANAKRAGAKKGGRPAPGRSAPGRNNNAKGRGKKANPHTK